MNNSIWKHMFWASLVAGFAAPLGCLSFGLYILAPEVSSLLSSPGKQAVSPRLNGFVDSLQAENRRLEAILEQRSRAHPHKDSLSAVYLDLAGMAESCTVRINSLVPAHVVQQTSDKFSLPIRAEFEGDFVKLLQLMHSMERGTPRYALESVEIVPVRKSSMLKMKMDALLPIIPGNFSERE